MDYMNGIVFLLTNCDYQRTLLFFFYFVYLFILNTKKLFLFSKKKFFKIKIVKIYISCRNQVLLLILETPEEKNFSG